MIKHEVGEVRTGSFFIGITNTECSNFFFELNQLSPHNNKLDQQPMKLDLTFAQDTNPNSAVCLTIPHNLADSISGLYSQDRYPHSTKTLRRYLKRSRKYNHR